MKPRGLSCLRFYPESSHCDLVIAIVKSLWGWLLLVLVAFLLGWVAGGYRAQWGTLTTITKMRSDDVAQREQLLAELSDATSRLEVATRSRNVAEARAESLQEKLDIASRQSIDDLSELALYRRIADEAAPTGLWIDSIKLGDSQSRELIALEITLVQSRGRGRAAGLISVTILDDSCDGAPLAQSGQNHQVPGGDDTDSEPAAATANPPLEPTCGTSDAIEANFDLRFFQTVEILVEIAPPLAPEYVEVSIKPDGERLKSSVQRISWSEIEQ